MKRFAKQFRVPGGFLGKIAGKIMYFENKKINKWTIDNLSLTNGQTVLEIGFGPGYAIGLIAERCPDCTIEGIDLSTKMKEETANKHEHLLNAGKLKLWRGDIADFNFPSEKYDRIFSVNNFPLWKNPQETLARFPYALKNGGKVAITVQPREEGDTNHTARELGEQLEHGLKEAGLENICISFKNDHPVLAVCATAEKPHR
ncbi:class I SAM-dependent DNA methyltransferase [Neobacillus piezotolerans]|uniref:class I SAM-dependent DNA methyltransferase n=1 Tax=Neobacillus piezotolerans TaxID=2259171 RepID=UPI0015F1468E|nr:class I SAM-dependent methyltransferase [Neobacillus piezotolerans]